MLPAVPAVIASNALAIGLGAATTVVVVAVGVGVGVYVANQENVWCHPSVT